MARNKTAGKKRRLARAGKQTKWAPFWLMPKIFGVGRRVHPSRITAVKRNWRRNKIED